MSNTPSLLPCPFCGAVPHLKRSTRGDYTSIVCHGECSGPLVIVIPNDLIEEGAAAWNRRTPQPVVREPLTQEQVSEIADAAHREYDRLVSSGQCAPRWSAVFAYLLERAHGITQRGGSNAE